MGNSSSSRTAVTNDISNYLTETQKNNIQTSCSASQKSSNIINIHRAKNCQFKSIKQISDLTDGCMFHNAIKQMSKTDIQSAANNNAFTKAAAAGVFNSANSSTSIRNTLTSQTDIQKLNNIIESCASKQDATNILNVSDCSNSQFVDINQMNNMTNKCIQGAALKQFSDNKSLIKAVTKASATSTAGKKSQGGGPPPAAKGGGGGSSTKIIGVIAICIIFCICCCCLILLGGGGIMMAGSSKSKHSGEIGETGETGETGEE